MHVSDPGRLFPGLVGLRDTVSPDRPRPGRVPRSAAHHVPMQLWHQVPEAREVGLFHVRQGGQHAGTIGKYSIHRRALIGRQFPPLAESAHGRNHQQPRIAGIPEKPNETPIPRSHRHTVGLQPFIQTKHGTPLQNDGFQVQEYPPGAILVTLAGYDPDGRTRMDGALIIHIDRKTRYPAPGS